MVNENSDVTIEQYGFGTALVEILTGIRSEAAYIQRSMARLPLSKVCYLSIYVCVCARAEK